MVDCIVHIVILQGVKQVFAHQCWHKSLTPLMEKIRQHFKDIPTYCTFDIDAIDSSNCPGTGMYIVIQGQMGDPPPLFLSKMFVQGVDK